MMSTAYIILAAIMLGTTSCHLRDLTVGADGHLGFQDLAKKFARPAVSHYITTEDGYIICLFNIPGDRARPVLLSHGVFDSANGWLLRGNRSLGYLLASAGYDVWFSNNRGNRYSRNHTSLDPDKHEQFWQFSADEYSLDMAAIIDHILNYTGQEQLSVVGFSEGTTSMFILGSTRPEYNKKVKIFTALAPVVFMEHVRPALSVIIGLSPIMDFFMPRTMQEIGGFYSVSKAFINMLCTQLAISYEICYQGGMNSVSGSNSLGIEREFFPTIVAHFPAGTSRKNLMHFAQISTRKTFAAYDYGAPTNVKVYKSITPPQYDLSKMTMKTVLISGPNDIVSTLEDVERLKQHLPNVIEHKIVDLPCFNHLDFMWGKDAPELVYYDVLDILKKYA